MIGMSEVTDRTVIGIDDRSLLSRSTCCTCFRSATKCELSFSDASGDNLGAQRLQDDPTSVLCAPWTDQDGDRPFAVRDEALHLVKIDFPLGLLFGRSVHVQRHDVLGDRLSAAETLNISLLLKRH